MRFNSKILSVLVVALSLAACGSPHPSPHPSAPRQSLSPISATQAVPTLGGSSNSLALPLTPYFPSPEQSAVQHNLLNELLSACAQRKGFNYPVIIDGQESFGGDPGYGQFYAFGVTSLKYAESNGYHGISNSAPRRTASGAPVPRNISGSEENVLAQCFQGISKYIGTPESWIELAVNLGAQAWGTTNSDPRVVAAFKRWSGCMAEHGFHYATPLQALAGEPGGSARALQWQTPLPSQLERTTATTDVLCKQKTGLLRIWISVLVSYQESLVQKNLPQLQAAMAAFGRAVRTEQKMIGRSA